FGVSLEAKSLLEEMEESGPHLGFTEFARLVGHNLRGDVEVLGVEWAGDSIDKLALDVEGSFKQVAEPNIGGVVDPVVGVDADMAAPRGVGLDGGDVERGRGGGLLSKG